MAKHKRRARTSVYSDSGMAFWHTENLFVCIQDSNILKLPKVYSHYKYVDCLILCVHSLLFSFSRWNVRLSPQQLSVVLCCMMQWKMNRGAGRE